MALDTVFLKWEKDGTARAFSPSGGAGKVFDVFFTSLYDISLAMDNLDDNRRKRLEEEYRHTLMLLNSPRLSAETRRVLEALRADLERQITGELA